MEYQEATKLFVKAAGMYKGKLNMLRSFIHLPKVLFNYQKAFSSSKAINKVISARRRFKDSENYIQRSGLYVFGFLLSMAYK